MLAMPERRTKPTADGYQRIPRDGGITTARRLVIDFLESRINANNARLAFLLDPSPENLTAWVDWENKALGDEKP